MEADMDKGLGNILCTKIDEHAGDWPSESFIDFFRIAKQCVEPKMTLRPEIAGVRGPGSDGGSVKPSMGGSRFAPPALDGQWRCSLLHCCPPRAQHWSH